MRYRKVIRSLRAGFFGSAAILLAVTGCNKSSPPAPTVESKAESKPASPIIAREPLDWNLETLVRAYEKVGSKNSQWDDPAKNALTLFARFRSGNVETNEPATKIIGTNCDLAIAAGCDDPMIGYLHARYSRQKEHDARAFALAADALERSQYPAIRKFYASLRAAEHIVSKAGRTNTPPEVHKYRMQATTHLTAAITDKSIPIREVDEACHQMLKALDRNSAQYTFCWQRVEPPLTANWPEEPVTWLLKGIAYTKLAWFARGGGYANTVSDQQADLFAQKLTLAQQALETAWQKDPADPRIACAMMTIELGQGRGRGHMEMWFSRAMVLDPNCYDACDAKRYYLEPKWYGSAEEMLAFGRDCVRTKAWGGHVPLVLVDAHAALVGYLDESQRAAYWKQPGVWTDLKAAFERFFELEPNAIGWRHNYAKYAYLCEQWKDLNKQLTYLDNVNYDYFGGEAEFEKMVRLAKEHARK